MELLDIVVAHAVHGISLGDAAVQARLSKPTAHRLLSGLRNAGLIDYVSHRRLFFPAFKLFRMGQAAGARFDVVRLAAPHLQRLAQETGDTVYLALRSGDFTMCADRYSGDFPIKMLTLGIGDTRPLGLGSNGLALLSALSDDEVERLIERHSAALAAYPAYTGDALRRQVAETRANGYAINLGLMLPEMSAVAMGVRSPDGALAASVSIAALTSRIQPPRLASLLELLRREVSALEQRMATPATS